MPSLRRQLVRVAHEQPETRRYLVPLLRQAREDSHESARKFAPLDPSKNKDYAKGVNKSKYNWTGKNRGPGKCYYQTGDPKDRCYVTTNGGPGGQTKPSTGPAGKAKSPQRHQYNMKYRKQRTKKNEK